MRKAWVLVAIAGALACDESGLAGSPQITLTAQGTGDTLKVEWYRVVGAERYQLWVDSQMVYEGEDTVFYLASPARLFRTVAIGGSEKTADEEDISALTDSVELWERDGEGVSAVGFFPNPDESHIVYALSDTAEEENFSLYLDDFRTDTVVADSVRMVSPNFNALGDPFNDKRTLFAPWGPDPTVAPDTGSYSENYSSVMVAGSTYAVWLDPDTTGWEDHSSDHFLRIQVLSVEDSTGKVVFRYWLQKIPGLRWVPEAPQEGE